jgi:3-hydroxyacyl-[acyl-carrier-protein] dehydratase
VSQQNFLYDITTLDFSRPVATLEDVRKYNPQRFEMEQLTAVVYVDESQYLSVSYKDTSTNDFWVRGHFPHLAIMPGVVMLESIAQLCSYVTQRYDLLGAEVVGFGGLEDVRFRDVVFPGERFVVLSKLEKVRRGRMIICQFQGVVGDRLCIEGTLKGVPIPITYLQNMQKQAAAENAKG